MTGIPGVSSDEPQVSGIRALKMVVALQQLPEGRIHHIDRGSQYDTHDDQSQAEQVQIVVDRMGNRFSQFPVHYRRL